MTLVKIVFFILAFSAAVFAQTVPDQYIVQLAGQPAGHVRARVAEIRVRQAAIRKSVEQSGAQVLDSTQAVLNALMVRMPASQASKLSSIPRTRTPAEPARSVRPKR